VVWKEVEGGRILSGKKNKATKTDLHPPVATDNMRQFFSQNAGVLVAEQSTEPWPAFNVRGIGDPHESQNVLLLQDGLPMPMDMYGSGGQYVAPPAPLMDEIEVINGGAALMYGPQPGGAINFRSPQLTRDTTFGGKVGATYGSYDLISTVNSVKGKSGNTAYWGGYFRKQGKGYQRAGADFSADHLQLKTHTFRENGDVVKLGFQGYDSDFGQPGGMTRDCGVANANCWDGDGDNRTASRRNDRLKIARALLSIGYEDKLSDSTTLETTLWTSTYNRYSATQTSGAFGTRPTGTTLENRLGHAHAVNVESRLRHDWQRGEQQHTFTAGVLSYNTNSPTTSWTGPNLRSTRGTVSARAYNQSRVLALFAENRFDFGRWTLVPGARFENITLSTENRLTEVDRAETFNVILGGLGASFDLSTETQAYANVSQGFKPVGFSTVLQQATATTTVQGDIDPSYTYNYEAGVRGDTAAWNWDVSGYWVHYQNQVATSGNTIFNGRSAHYRGIEASLTRKDVLRREAHTLDLYANANLLDARYRGGSLEGKTPLYAPKTTVKYGAIYRNGEAWRASLLATYLSGHYANDTNTDQFYIPSYQIFDLLAEARVGEHWSVNGAVNNLLDKTYYSRVRDTGIQALPGRNFYLGANYRF
jgi:Fe(3+) dicitrate transport protein